MSKRGQPGFRVWIAAGVGLLCSAAAPVAGVLSEPLAIEPEVGEAFDRAVARYPEPMRARLREVGLLRRAALEARATLPLSARLYAAAAYAYYDVQRDEVVILDAGVRERGVWAVDTPLPADWETEVEGFLREVAPSLGLPAALPAAELWAAFASVVGGWGEEPAIWGRRPPAFGETSVFDRFVRLGVGRLVGGPMPLESQIVHELAHAVQLHASQSAEHVLMWGSLSGWVQRRTGEPVRTHHAMEHPRVLISLVLAGERGEAWYEFHPEACMVNAYAAYDAREDYAESVRWFLERPGDLLACSPVKFMFINAIGLNSLCDVDAPGPLWHDAASLAAHGWLDDVNEAAGVLLGSSDHAVQVHPLAAIGVLRAHASLLTPGALPRGEVLRETARDLPGELRDRLAAWRFHVEIRGETFALPAAQIRRWWALEAARAHENREFAREWFWMIHRGAADAQRAIKGLPELVDDERIERVEALLAAPAADLPEEDARAMATAEAERFDAIGRPLLAHRVRVCLAAREVGAAFEEAVASALQAAEPEAGSYDAVLLLACVARLELGLGRPDAAMAAAGRIRGGLAGAIAGVDLFLMIHEAAPGLGALEAAARSADQAEDPDLRARLQERIAGATPR